MCRGPSGSYRVTFTEVGGNCGWVEPSLVRWGETGEAAGWPSGATCELLAQPYVDKCGSDTIVQCMAAVDREAGVIETARIHAIVDWDLSANNGRATYDVRVTYSDGVGDCQSLYDVAFERP